MQAIHMAMLQWKGILTLWKMKRYICTITMRNRSYMMMLRILHM